MNIEKVVVRLLAGLAVAACGAVPGHAQSDVRERVKAIAAQAGMALPADAEAPEIATPGASAEPAQREIPAARAASPIPVRNSPKFGDVVKKEQASSRFCPGAQDGEICLMTQTNAAEYCKEQGTDLPSAREFAQRATATRGVTGIVEVEKYERYKRGVLHQYPFYERPFLQINDFYHVDRFDDNGDIVIDFYYSDSGNRSTGGESQNFLFWSSSPNPNKNDAFYGYLSGDIVSQSAEAFAAVRCIAHP